MYIGNALVLSEKIGQHMIKGLEDQQRMHYLVSLKVTQLFQLANLLWLWVGGNVQEIHGIRTLKKEPSSLKEIILRPGLAARLMEGNLWVEFSNMNVEGDCICLNSEHISLIWISSMSYGGPQNNCLRGRRGQEL